jgi:sugar lactone lactonase YvrE
VEPELIADYQCVCGEGPLWHPMEKRLYWTDIPTGRMFRYDPVTGAHEQFYQGEVVGGFTIQADGSLLLFMARGAVKQWRDGALTTVVEEIPAERESRFNDVIADPMGRVYCGTMPTPSGPGRLYLLDNDGSISLLLEGVGCSNGLGFTPDRKGLYHTDTRKREITLYYYDAATGAITGPRVAIRTPEGEGAPDGMTVDAEGFIWTAKWGGGCAVRYAPDGNEDRRIHFPARKVSCVTFGGEGYDEMYVTTAGGDQKEADGAGAGALFRVRPGMRGVPEFLSRVCL